MHLLRKCEYNVLPCICELCPNKLYYIMMKPYKHTLNCRVLNNLQIIKSALYIVRVNRQSVTFNNPLFIDDGKHIRKTCTPSSAF